MTTKKPPRRTRRALDRPSRAPKPQPKPAVKDAHVTPEERRRLFAAHYRLHHNATAAAIAAGLSPKTAPQAGVRMLRHVQVLELLSEGARRDHQIVARAARKLEVTRETILAELARIGFSDIRRLVSWDTSVIDMQPDTEEALEPQGHGGALKRRSVAMSNVRLIASDEIDDDTAAAISEISQSATGGLKIKLHNKPAALVNLGRAIGMFGEDTGPQQTVNLIISGLYDKERPHERPAPRTIEGEATFRDPARK